MQTKNTNTPQPTNNLTTGTVPNPAPITTLPNYPTTQPQFRHAYSPRFRVGLSIDRSEDVTKQSFKSECDINVIMARYMNTGVIDFVTKHQAHYGDVSDVDYQTAMQTVAEANSMFEELPSQLRTRFGNDPANFLQFVSNPNNRPEMAELGLLKPAAALLLKTGGVVAPPPIATPPAPLQTNPQPSNTGAEPPALVAGDQA